VPFQLVMPMYYTYVLRSECDRQWYTGATADLKARIEDHAQGRVRATRGRHPMHLAYYEACGNASDAYRRERYLKSGRGKRYLRQRLSVWLDTVSPKKLERH
jgi:putative endonuclease